MARMTSDCLPHQVERTKTLFGYFVDNGSQHQFKVGGRPASASVHPPCMQVLTTARPLRVSCARYFKVGGRPATITISRGRSHGFNYVRAHRPRRRPSPAANPPCPRRRHAHDGAMPTTAPSHGGAIPTAVGCEDSVSRESDPN